MDAMLENMRNTFGNGVRKMFSTNMGVKNSVNTMEKHPSDIQVFKMSLCNICALEGSNVPFIIRDICKFISSTSMKLEGIFRVSAPMRQVTELKEEYDSCTDVQNDFLLYRSKMKEVSGHAAAGLLKQFLRQLPEPLIHEDVLQMFLECKTLSDEAFSQKVCSCMISWHVTHRCTLLFLLSFLHTVAQESENRMSINGLAVVFGPNVFKLPDGVQGLQAQGVANMTFERLLSCSALLCEGCEEMTPNVEKSVRPTPPQRPLPPAPQSPSSPRNKPRRPAPPVPPPQDSTGHRVDTFSAIHDFDFIDSSEKGGEVLSGEEEGLETEIDGEEDLQEDIHEEIESCDETVIKPKKNDEFTKILDTSIRKVVQTRLFNSAETSSVSDDAESLMTRQSTSLLPSTTAGRNRGPKNRRRPSRKNKPLLSRVQLDNDSDEEELVAITKVSTATTHTVNAVRTVTMATEPQTISTSNIFSASTIPDYSVTMATNPASSTVMTPDSGCVVEDSDYPRNSSPIKKELAMLDSGRSPTPADVFIPKLNLRSSLDDEEFARLRNVTPPPSDDLVPQLDLSSVVESEDYGKPKPLPRIPYAEKLASKPIEKTPPRPAPRHSPVKQALKKKKKQKKPVSKNQQETPTQSDSDITDDFDETMEQARDRMLNVLRENRKVAGRPFDLSRMAVDDLKDEKVSMQRELLKFEARHGRPTTKQSKQVMREVYDRYRGVKRAVVKWQSDKGERDENENTIAATSQELGDSFAVTRQFPTDVLSCEESDVIMEGDDLGASEMLQKVNELRAKKRRLRKILQEFENERKMTLEKGDATLERGVMKSEYRQYREVKNKLRSIEEELAKKGIDLS